MKKIYLLFCLFFILAATNIFGYDYLYVQDPKSTWRSGQGTIEEAVLSIKPKGLYLEYGLYTTFSAKNNYYNFNHNDTLEVQFYFDLPDGAIVHDLWLWVGDSIMQAIIMDKWTASSIYENIVKRRRDPAILYKRGNNSYELRIFPMAGDETRKIKLTYLVPTAWTSNSVSAPLPANLLLTSMVPPKLSLLYWPDPSWKNPRISEASNINFYTREDSVFKTFLWAEIPASNLNNSLSFQLDSPLKNGIYLSRLSNTSEGYYQLAMLPGESFDLNNSRKVAILIDHDASKTNINTEAILSGLKSMLKANFSSKDSFNLIFSGLDIKRAGENWIPGDSLTIESVFHSLGSNPVSSYSNLPSLLSNGVDFINNNGKDASILLISSSDQAGNFNVANPLIEDLKKKMEVVYPVYVVDFVQNSNNYYYIGDRYYYANEYFFNNISRLTSGEYQNIRNTPSLANMISTSLQSLSGFISSFDFYTTLQDGFCYGRFNLDKSNTVYLNKPILQVGKFSGNFPFKIQTSGVFKSETFTRNLTIDSAQVFTSDTLVRKMWAGNYIKSLESQPQANNIINEIVDYSISERVLSLYSAFIALEPSDSVRPCYDCMDESGILDEVEDEVFLPSDSLIQAYPNPFNSQVTLQVRVPSAAVNSNPTFKIYNILGEVVKTFDVEVTETNRNLKLSWDSKNDYGSTVSSGIYLFVMETPQNRYSVKIVLMK